MNPLEISTDEFRRLAARVTELASSYLDELDAKPISPSITGDDSVRIFESPPPEQGLRQEAFNSLPDILALSRAQNGRFFGYVLGSGEPVASVADLLASVVNQNVTAWRSGPAAVVVEQIVVGWLAQALGCSGFRGHLSGGGSSANLMGLTMARESKMPSNEKGIASGGMVYASDEVHMSIPKSVALLGIGRDNLRLIPTDASFRMIPEELDKQIDRDRRSGKIPVAIVASAGTVNTGAIDPLSRIADIAERHKTWFHIDGAYGALAAMAEPSKFAGLNRADSISLDPHKWLYQPLDCGCLLYRSAEAAQSAFSHSGEYARTLSTDPVEGFAFFEESLELSRRFRALKLWLSLRYHGLGTFRESIRKDMAQAQRLASAIQNTPELELLAPVELSAVCFRHRGQSSEKELNRFNANLLKRVVQAGKIYLSNAMLRGKFCLRACIVNHRTTDADIDAVVPEVLAAATQIRGI